MAATVFYVDSLPEAGRTAVLDGPEGRHASTVRRFGVGDRLLLSDTRGGVAECAVTAVGKDRLDLLVHSVDRRAPAQPEVTLVQALPKSERSELAVDLATEAGVDRIIPWQAVRCVSRWHTGKLDKSEKGVARWRAVAYAAAKQSRRVYVPEVTDLHTTAMVVERVAELVAAGGAVLVLHESATTALGGDHLAGRDAVTLVVGPEGGLDDAEVAALVEAGAQAVRLGPTVLRTSSAAAVALGAIGVLTDRWTQGPLE